MTKESKQTAGYIGIIFAIGLAWGTLTMQVKSIQSNVNTISNNVSHMQMYLSSKDPNYWKQSGDQP